MNVINNSFVRAVLLVAIGVGCFGIAKYCGASDVRGALISTGTMLTGVAAGALQHKRDDDDAPANPIRPGTPGQPKL